jgi:hypothetical protein
MHSNEWWITETNLVFIASTSCEVKTEHTILKPVDTYEEYHIRLTSVGS